VVFLKASASIRCKKLAQIVFRVERTTRDFGRRVTAFAMSASGQKQTSQI
jgi:hypothetical protein